MEELNDRFSPAFTLLDERRPTRAYAGREGRELLRVYQRKGPTMA